MTKQRDYVERRIVVEYGRRYIYAYMTTGDGKIVGDNEESWQQPYVLDIAEVREEAKDLYDWIWQHMTDMVNGTLQEGEDDQPESS